MVKKPRVMKRILAMADFAGMIRREEMPTDWQMVKEGSRSWGAG
jgi:hypothetical protein